QSRYHPQLEWEANVAEFVLFLHRETRAPAVPRGSTEISSERALRSGIPIYGPRFLPPSLNDTRLRWGKNKTETTYLRPINIIHPVYYDNLGTCPHCGSTDVKWDSWNAMGSREVHGLRWEETEVPITPQDVYTRCRFYNAKEWLLCNDKPGILEDWVHWKIPSKSAIIFAHAQTVTFIPGGIPYFFSRHAVYMAFVERTHSEESDEYLRNLSPGICLSADNTFKAAGKATVADSSKARSKLVKSTLSLNKGNEIVAWRFCQSASPAEMREVLEGFKKRCVELNVDLPEMMVVDNCCQVR
ncbi:hypothetical protein C8J57DRAFT_991054, partial [Mycena rebaudengoi]